MLDKRRRRMTPEEFYTWQQPMEEKYELVDGFPCRNDDIGVHIDAGKRTGDLVAEVQRVGFARHLGLHNVYHWIETPGYLRSVIGTSVAHDDGFQLIRIRLTTPGA